ncbi:MAG: acyltransferase [Isosphaeraceae bacterium]
MNEAGQEPTPIAVPNEPNLAPPAVGSELPGRLYFPELDGLRFVAFALVFLFHQGVPSVVIARYFGRETARCFRENGWVGVQLFFILSGFLIVTLLLREEEIHGRVRLSAFWVRRILRIWPLYYLTVVLAFIVVPLLSGAFSQAGGGENLKRHLPAFLAFLGNWSMAFRGPVSFDCQSILWSVCVEEQFYLVVPLIVAFVPRRARIPLVCGMIVAAVAIRGWLSYGNANQLMIQYNTLAQFDTLGSGVLLALLLGASPREHAGLSRWLRWLQWPLYVAILWVITRSNLGHGEAWRRTWDFVAIWLAGLGIVAVAVSVPGWLQKGLSHRRIVWLGQISYGLYMYHEIAIWLKGQIAGMVGWFPFEEEILPLVSLGITIGLAALSYQRFERPFLELKRRWTRVPSRPV